MSYSFQTQLTSFGADGIIIKWCLIIGLALLFAATIGKFMLPKGAKRWWVLFTLYSLLMVVISVGGTCGAQRYLVHHQFFTMFGEPVPRNWDEHAKLEPIVVARLLDEQNYFGRCQSNYLASAAKLAQMPRATTNDVEEYLSEKQFGKYYWDRDHAYSRLDVCQRLRVAAYAAGYQEEVLAIPFEVKMD